MTDAPSHLPPAWWDLARTEAYRAWREQVLGESVTDFTPVRLRDLSRLSAAEIDALASRLHAAGAVCYGTDRIPEPRDILALGEQLGLVHLDHHQCAEPDGVARLTAREDTAGRFIPYTRHRLRWHTDGYYQPDTQKIRSFVLHCVQPALDGGVNRLLDPRLLYIALRDENPDLIQALIHPRALTVPAHAEDGEERRAEFSGPVFSIDGEHLYMRYTERAIHIRWHPETEPARTRVQELLETLPQAGHLLRLDAGCGLIAHNVLHCRSAYADSADHPRLLYRTRYTDRARRPC
ncbi:MAG: TauD/TfdA family dioxygenase [Gammaproteobacteria bacterium]|nr:TauD/TfdA family dioxygenase [Gammaproteobacteria bacterium]